MTKLVIFDLDGVLIDSKDYHYEALNKALGPEYVISREDHVSNAMSTGMLVRSVRERHGHVCAVALGERVCRASDGRVFGLAAVRCSRTASQICRRHAMSSTACSACIR